MAYQNIRRAPQELYAPQEYEPAAFERAYRMLAQEVIACHNSIQVYTVAIANGLALLATTFPVPTKGTAYFVGVMPNFTNGGTWVTGQTTTGCTINWVTASPVSATLTILVIE